MYEQLTQEKSKTLPLLTQTTEELFDIKQTAERLSVSTATIRNWVKLGRLVQTKTFGRKLLFKKDTVEKLVDDIRSGKTDKLTKRRNKKAVRGLDLYTDYIRDSGTNIVIGADLVKNTSNFFDEGTIRFILSELALKLYLKSQGIADISLNDFVNKKVDDDFSLLLRELLAEEAQKMASRITIPIPTFVPFQDFLGYIYISINKVSNRKSTGSYFTPIDVVDHLMDILFENGCLNSADIVDPCCGTGNFLLAALKRGVPAEHLYGNDIDAISVTLTKINLYINGIHNIKLLNSHFKSMNFLTEVDKRNFDVILGNPPWGYDFSSDEVKQLMHNYATAAKHGTESYDLFVEKSLQKVRNNGIIAYVLPEAILNVKAHSVVRALIKKNTSISFVSYIGNSFTGVTCPCVLLGLKKNYKGNTVGCRVETADDAFTIHEARDLSNEYWNFSFSDEEARCLNKIAYLDNAFILKGRSEFALGIVTGANKDYISNTRLDNTEPVLKGSDIFKYGFETGSHFIRFVPENFQQVAPVALYRAPEKLIYRFICATPVFAYDNKKTLSLNSANILIPHVEGINIKYILALLNSRTVSYWCRKKYNSVKLLRSHIEGIPLPFPDVHQQEDVVNNVNKLLSISSEKKNERLHIYAILEDKIMNLYQLNEQEKDLINNDTKRYDSFL